MDYFRCFLNNVLYFLTGGKGVIKHFCCFFWLKHQNLPHSAAHCNNGVCLFARLKVRAGRMGSNSSLSVSSQPDPQDSWELLKPASLVSSAAARSVCLSLGSWFGLHFFEVFLFLVLSVAAVTFAL